MLREYAKFDFDRRLADRVPDDQAISELRDTLDTAAKFGITSLQDMSNIMPPSRCVALLDKIPVEIRVRVKRMPTSTPCGRDTQEGWPAPVIINPLIRVSGTKWMLDGVPVEGTLTPRDQSSPIGELTMHLPLTFPKAEMTSMLQESLRNEGRL